MPCWFEGRILGTQSGEGYRHRDTFLCCNSRLADVVSVGESGDCGLLMDITTFDKRGKYSLPCTGFGVLWVKLYQCTGAGHANREFT